MEDSGCAVHEGGNCVKTTMLGRCFETSRLALGGGGIGQVWGSTDRDEAIATVHAAYEAGIDFFDLAPLYGRGEAEHVMGLAFAGGYPDDVKLTTKCMLGDAPVDEIESRLNRSLEESCERLARDRVDVFILHGYLIEDGWSDCIRPSLLPHIGVQESRFAAHVVPVFEAWKASGRVAAWGITAASTQAQNLGALDAGAKPDVVQCITNLLDSPGGMAIAVEEPQPRDVIARASELGVGVMGIRALAAGALAQSIDRSVAPESAERRDFDRARAFRVLAAESGKSPAFLAHQYALAMQGVDTVVLGVKNRAELMECLAAEAAEPMDSSLREAIDRAVS